MCDICEFEKCCQGCLSNRCTTHLFCCSTFQALHTFDFCSSIVQAKQMLHPHLLIMFSCLFFSQLRNTDFADTEITQEALTLTEST